jgi:tripartite-type tricarboxylate transporter receptor subunit TctC
MEHIPYKGNSAAWPDLISGRVGLLMEPYSSGAAMIRGGQLKALAVSSTKRLEVLPEVPTFAEQGVATYDFYLWMGLLAPAGTPKDVLDKLNDAMRSALTSPDLKKRFRDEGSEVMTMSSQEFTQFLNAEAGSFTKLVTALGLPKE